MVWWWQMCMKFQKNDRILLCVLNKCIKLVWKVVVFSVHWEFYAFISQLWCNHTWSFIRNTKYVQKSAHNQTGTPPPDVIRNPHLLPGIRLFFWHSCLFFQNSSFCGSANQRRANGKFATVLRRTEADQICALGLFRNSLFQSLLAFVGRSGGCMKGWRCLWSL